MSRSMESCVSSWCEWRREESDPRVQRRSVTCLCGELSQPKWRPCDPSSGSYRDTVLRRQQENRCIWLTSYISPNYHLLSLHFFLDSAPRSWLGRFRVCSVLIGFFGCSLRPSWLLDSFKDRVGIKGFGPEWPPLPPPPPRSSSSPFFQSSHACASPFHCLPAPDCSSFVVPSLMCKWLDDSAEGKHQLWFWGSGHTRNSSGFMAVRRSLRSELAEWASGEPSFFQLILSAPFFISFFEL